MGSTSVAVVGSLLLVSSLQAQIDQLATSGDGSVLLFRSQFRLQSETELGSQGKIYRWQDGRWTRLAAARDIGFALVPPNVFGPFLSTDGTIVGWQTLEGCILCQFVVSPPFGVDIQGLTLPPAFPRGNVRMSANGRYFTGDRYNFPGNAKYLDVATGAMADLPIDPFVQPTIREVANDGTALLKTSSGLTLWTPAGSRIIYQETRVGGATLSPEGGRVALEAVADDRTRMLTVIDTVSGERIPIAVIPATLSLESHAKPSWDVSGTFLLYRSFDDGGRPSAIELWDAVTRQSRTLLRHEEGFSMATISGNGHIVWAVTGANRLLRLDPWDGSMVEILPPLGAMTKTADGEVVPGSATLIRGAGFTRGQSAIDGDVSLPMVDAGQEGLWVQIPWEYDTAPQGRHNLVIRSPGSPFESLATVTVGRGVLPLIATTSDLIDGMVFAKAVHQDFSSLVTRSNPARPGETIHLYLTGLGPLDRMVPTGAPGPYDPQARPLAPLRCALGYNPPQYLDMPFLAYAAGLVGIYQADLTMPGELRDGDVILSCGSMGADGRSQGSAAMLSVSAN